MIAVIATTTLVPLTGAAQEGLAPGSVATNAAGEAVLIRTAPGYDAAGAGELAVGQEVTVADYAVTAADGSLWYPVAGGYVPASALGSGTATDTAAPISGYYDANGVWIEDGTAAVPVEGATGYYDVNGVWVDTAGAAPVTEAAPAAESATGYYDVNGVWVDTSSAAPVAETATGYYDVNGIWVDTTGAAPAEAVTAQPADTTVAGYYDENGIWIEDGVTAAPAESTTGYYDQNGIWVDTDGAAAESAPVTEEAAPAPVETGTGYYDQNGVWVDTAAAADPDVQYNNSAGDSNTTGTAASLGTAYIAGTNGEGAICRSGADWSAGEIATIGEGSSVEVTGGAVGEWTPITCNGSAGYVNSSFISWDAPVAATESKQRKRNRGGTTDNVSAAAPTSTGGQAVVDYAMGYLGSPYVYAGAGPGGFDCSGFTMFVVQATLGMDISHSVPTQYSMGTQVSKNQLVPGDLVFFENTNGPGLSHVGIYIGNGQFVHAENESTGVVISDLNSGYYSSHYYGAVRLG